jgi:hypothetical protein
MNRHRAHGTSLRGLGLLVVGLFSLTACDGENLFVSGPVNADGGADNGKAPTVQIVTPTGDSTSAKPIGDSVLVSARIEDKTGIQTVQFDGFAFRGDVNLGTAEIVERFETKVIDLLSPTADTTLTRYLIPTTDSTRETAHLIVTATDTLGNVAADTVRLILGGPDVQVLNLVGGEFVQSGRTLSLRILAVDPGGVRSIEVITTGVVASSTSTPITPTADSVTLDTSVDIPAGVEGQMELIARARNNLDVIGQVGPFTLNVITGETADSVPPTVTFVQTSPGRMELQDVLQIDISASDDNQGSGIARAGYTVIATSATRGTSEIVSNEIAYAPSRTGNLAQTFQVPGFHADPLSLPDTLVYEISAFVVDERGNCAASVGTAGGESLECATLPGGQIVAQDRQGKRDTRVFVDGRTVLLPTGGVVMDAVVDSTRRQLYLSNIARDRIEVFDLTAEVFNQGVAVGSEPWGLAMDTGGDNLLVANSGGTNISNMDLTPATPSEDVAGRILTPDVVFFDVALEEDTNGSDRYVVTFSPNIQGASFSDRPQYLAVDANNRILYSTRTTPVGQLGTIRRAIRGAGFVQPEVRVFYEHTAHLPDETANAIGNVDGVAPSGDGSVITITDHQQGDPDIILTSTPGIPSDAVTSIQGLGSDAVMLAGQRWNIAGIGFNDTTFVAASGDGRWVVFGEGAASPIGRIIMYESATDALSGAIPVSDLITNASEVVRGIGLNYDGTLGVARGDMAYFFTTDLRLQGVADLPAGGSGAVLHPLHADAVSLANSGGSYLPDVHMAFVGTGEGTIDIIDTFHFFRSGRIFIRDNLVGPLKAVLPFPEDNAGLTCATQAIFDETGAAIGNAIDIFNGDDFQDPYPALGGPTEDACVVLKLFGVTAAEGVVVVNVRKSDILRDHPAR